MMFDSRADAGRRLGLYVQEAKLDVEIVLGLPRGGVLVAAEVAQLLHLPLNVLVVRKIGHPRNREFAVGALAEDGTVLLAEEYLARTGVIAQELEKVIEEETARLAEYRSKFQLAILPELEGKAVLIVDDGLATGATAEVAARSARKRGARSVIVGTPVASDNAVQRLAGVVDRVLALFIDPNFNAVGQYYDAFPQATDEEVRNLLAGRA